MALTGSTIASTYLKLLRVNTDTMGADASASYIQDSADTDSALSISTTRCGIGTAAPDGTLHVHTATAGTIAADADHDELVLENSAMCGMTILSGNGSHGTIAFGDDGDANDGILGYDQSARAMYIKVAGVNTKRIIIDANSRISLSNNDSGGTGGSDSTTGNTMLGYLSGNSIADGGVNNTFIGHEVGKASTVGTSNVGIGVGALDAIAVGESANIAIGESAMSAVDEGAANGDADFNIGIGFQALLGGDFAGNDRQLQGNIAIGGYALDATADNAQTGTIAIGHSALSALTSGARNTALGYETGGRTTTGADNTYIGYQAGDDTRDDSKQNTVVGSLAFAGTHNTADADDCVAIGYSALGAVLQHANVSGTVAIGSSALNALTSGAGNLAIGYQSLDATATGASNTMVGYQSGTALVDGSDNNTAVGYQAMLGGNNDVTHKNTVVGYQAGMQISNGFNNTLIGANVDVNTGSFDNVTAIGNNFEASQDDTVFLGNNDTEEVWMALDKGATVYCDKIAVGAGITQHSTTHLDVEGSIRAGCGSGDSGSTQAGQLMGLAGTTEGDNTVRLLKASMTSEGSLWVVSGYQGGTANRFVDLLLAYSGGVAVVSAQNTNSPDTRTYSIVAEALKLLINVTDSGEETYHIRMTGIGGNELAASTAPTMGGA